MNSQITHRTVGQSSCLQKKKCNTARLCWTMLMWLNNLVVIDVNESLLTRKEKETREKSSAAKYSILCCFSWRSRLGCKIAVLSALPIKKCSVNCLTSKQDTRKPHNKTEKLFRALTLRLHGKDRLAEGTSKLFAPFFLKMEVVNATKSERVSINDFPTQLLKVGAKPYSYCMTLKT